MAIPLQIISGFLGAGKTSAIRAQLEARRNERIAVIVNDFGEASLDAVALEDGRPFQLTNIGGACVCCTAPEGFVDALAAVVDTKPDRILIEPTGLARPQDLVDTIRRSAPGAKIALEPVVVLVDPGQLTGASLPLLRDQADAADILVANRTDRCSDEEIARFTAFSDALWPPPLSVHHAMHGRLDPASLGWPTGEGGRAEPRAVASAHVHGHDSTRGYVARSWKWAPEIVFARDRLGDTLARLATGRIGAPLARFKGIFRTLEGTYRLEVAGGDIEERLTPFRRDSRVDVILRADTSAPLEEVGEALAAAVMGEDELRLSGERIEVVLADGRVFLVDRDTLLGLPESIPDVSGLFPKRAGTAARIAKLWEALELPTAGAAVIVAGDGFASEPVPLEILREGVLLHSLEGEPLDAGAGGPFRLLIPDSANPPSGACANVKGVAKLVLRD